MNPNSLAPLALRRWFAGLTLSSPQFIPSGHGLWALVAGLGLLLLAAFLIQGPMVAARQLLDVPGHVRLARDSVRRVWRAGRLVAAAIAFTVISWTGAEALVYSADSGKTDLLLLTRARGRGELAIEQGILAGLTPLRDVAGLGDNLALLLVATIVVFRGSIEPQGAGEPPAAGRPRARARPGWTTLAWGIGALYVLYRVVARAAGSGDLPLGGCLVVEAVLIPAAMLIVDGLLLAWVLTELRQAGLEAAGEERLEPMAALALLPGSALACAVALPARYLAAFVFLAQAHLPTSVHATGLGDYIRWQLVGWGLTDVQAAALLFVGLVGVVAWTRGHLADALAGYRRLLAAEGARVVVALALAGGAATVLAAAAYAVVLLLPVQTWVLAAADSYAHFATLPVGLWTLAALIELAQRALPSATRVQGEVRARGAAADRQRERPAHQDVLPSVGASTL
jgi:hypothetical protein